MSVETRDSQSRSGAPEVPQQAAPVFRCFVFTDVEDSTGNWERHGEEFRESLDLHHAIIREVLREHGGRELTEAGDGFLLCFEECAYALRFAVDAQGRLDGADWPPLVGPLRVRMGIHAGEVEPRENGEYRGLVLNRAARIRDTAHGGQIVCSAAIAPHAERFAPTQELGAFRLRGLPAPERLYQVGDQRSFPPLRAVPAYTHNLPNNLSRFVGREKQIAKVRALLAPGEKKGRSSRLVTLTGPGGTGKTRLALATGESLLTEFSHAVWFVPLADVDDWELIAPSVRDALGIESDPSQLAVDQVAAFIAGEPALFVLDNFEQLAEQGAACIDQLLREMPQLRVLITSRHRLNLPQEREFAVPSLEIPGEYLEPEEIAEVESVALFVDRASQANPSFELTENNTAAVAELCRKLEGVPLALELAAARATVRTPREIVRELGARLDAFATSAPNTPARHRSLRAAVEWSFEYLPAALREFLSNLSIFRGGWTAEAAQAVAVPEHLAEVSSNVLRSLSELRALSLISAEERHDRMRFRMLETIRQYAAEQLSGEARKLLGERHLQFFHEFALEAERGCNGMDQAAWFDRIDLELDNIRAALRFPTTSDAPLLIASDLALFWVTRGHVEEMRGVLAHLQKAHPNAAPFARACTDVLAGHFALEASDYPAALKGFERALVYFEAIDDRKNIAAMLVNAGMAHRNVGSPDRAQEMMEKAVQLSREIARPQVLAPALQSLGSILLSLNRVDEAQAAFEESISIQRSIGDARMLSAALYNLADLKLELGRIEDAQPLVEECVHLRRTARERNTLASGFCMEGRLAREQKRYFAAASLNAAARLAFREFGPGAATGVEEEMEKTAAVVALHLTSEQLEAAERQGRVHLHAWLRDGD